MAASSKIQFLIICVSLCYHNSVLGVDYVISQNNNVTDTGVPFGSGVPIILQKGDTLTVSNNQQVSFNPNPDLAASPIPDPSLPPASSMIVAYGNNTITIETGSSFKSTQNGGALIQNTNLITFLGNGNSNIIVQQGATLQSADPASDPTYNLNLFSGGSEQVTLNNSGTLIGTGYFNNINRGTNTLILLGTAVSAQNTMNYSSENSSTGTSTLWVGGFIDVNGQTQLTKTNYVSNADYHPFKNVRVFAGSTLTFNSKTYLGTILTDSFIIDATASFTLTGAPSGGVAQLTLGVNNLENNGTLNVANTFVNGNIRTIQVANLNNTGVVSITNGSSIIGVNQNTSTIISAVSSSITITSGKISSFNIFANAGSLVVNDTLSNINIFNNNNKGLVTLMNGSHAANLGTLNNAYGSTFQINGTAFADVNGIPNYQTFTVNNQGIFSISAGTVGFLNITNDNVFTITGGTLTGFGLLSTIKNNSGGHITAGVGSVLTQINDIENYGIIDFSGATTDSSVVNINNYGTINHSVGALLVTNMHNKSTGIYNLTGNASISPPGSSILNEGKIVANTTGNINCSIVNGNPANGYTADLEITNLSLTYDITNDNILKILGPVTITPQSSSISSIGNNVQMELNNANIVITTPINNQNPIFNGATANIDVTGPVIINYQAGANDTLNVFNRYCNFTNDGVINLKATNGTFTYANSGTNVLLTTSIGTVNVYSSSVLSCSSAVPGSSITYANYGIHYAYINSVADPSTLTINGPADLKNCNIQFDVNPALLGNYSFKILDSYNILNPPASSTNVNTFLLKKSISYNNSMIFVDYYRQALNSKSFNLSDNAMQLANAIEKLLLEKKLTDPNLNAIYENIYNNAGSAQELNSFLSKMLPIGSGPIQNAVVQQSVFSQIDARMQATRVAYNSSDYKTGLSPWVKYFSTVNRQSATQNNLGYKFRTNGAVLGIDNYDGITTQYGASFTFALSKLEQHTNLPSKSKTHFYQANIYSQDIKPSNYYTDWIIGLAYSTTDQTRVDVVNGGKIAYARYSWQQFSGKYEFGHIFDLYKEYYFVPYVSAHYTFLKNYQYQEYNDAPNNLYIISPGKHVFEAALGFRTSTFLLLYGKNFIPKFTLGAKYCLSSPVYTIDAAILDQNILFQTFTKVPRLKYYAGAGATLEVIDNLNLSVNLEAEVYNKYLGLSYNFILRYLF